MQESKWILFLIVLNINIIYIIIYDKKSWYGVPFIGNNKSITSLDPSSLDDGSTTRLWEELSRVIVTVAAGVEENCEEVKIIVAYKS